MRPQPKQREPFTVKRLLIFAISLVVGMFLGWAMAHVGSDSPWGPLTFLLFFLAAVLVHELGHAVAALMVRFQVQSFTVGPLMLHREATGFRFRRSRVKLGGLVTIVPVGLYDLSKRMLIVIAGGPASSLLFAALAFSLGLTLGDPSRSSWMYPFSLMSAAVAVLSLIPIRRFYRSDGAQIWDLLRSPEKAERHCALLAIIGAAKSGVRPRDWDNVLIAKALSGSDEGAGDVSANVIAYEAAMDRREFDTAEKHLEAALSFRHKCPVNVKSSLALDAAFFYSVVRGDSALAHEWFKECDGRYIYDRYLTAMVEAAVLLSDRKLSEAADKARQSAGLLPRAQFPGFAAAAKDWLDIILARTETNTHDPNIEPKLTSIQPA